MIFYAASKEDEGTSDAEDSKGPPGSITYLCPFCKGHLISCGGSVLHCTVCHVVISNGHSNEAKKQSLRGYMDA